MNIKVYPSSPKGRISPPVSKSYMHRALFCAMATAGESKISYLDNSQDIEATLNVLRAFGGDVRRAGADIFVSGCDFTKGASGEIDCGMSGTTLRFAIPFALLGGEEVIFRGDKSLFARPMGAYQKLCDDLGLLFEHGENYIKVRGPLPRTIHKLTELTSSQFVSGVMLALGTAGGETGVLWGETPPSFPYIEMTADIMRRFGKEVVILDDGVRCGGVYKSPDLLDVERDWTQAAVWAGLAAINGEIEIADMNDESCQGDRKIADFLGKMGARAAENSFCKSKMQGITFDCFNNPDLAPAIAACACFAEGESKIINADRLIGKESNRKAAIVHTINILGGHAEMHDDMVKVYPKKPTGGVSVETYGDHRIAMMAAMLACGAEKPTEITGAECVAKSYPRFWEDLASLGVKIERI